MKRLKDYFKNMPFMSKINTYVVLFMLFIFLLVGMCSCSVQQIEPKPDFEIEWDSSKEDLLTPNKQDGKISGISRNGKKYTIVDGHGHKNGYLRTETKPDSNMIGTRLICRTEFR